MALTSFTRAFKEPIGRGLGVEVSGVHTCLNHFAYLVRWRDKNSYGEDVEKRMVSFPAGVKYDPRLVATEWFRWLQKTRHDPPTPEELQQCVSP